MNCQVTILDLCQLKQETFHSPTFSFGDIDVSNDQFIFSTFKSFGSAKKEHPVNWVDENTVYIESLNLPFGDYFHELIWIHGTQRDVVVQGRLKVTDKGNDCGCEPKNNYEIKVVTSETTVNVNYSERVIERITDKGPQGDSAYQVAVENGFIGTEAEWLESLHGEKGDPFTYDDFTPEQLKDLTKDHIPYTGADKPIDINTQSFSVNGLLEKNMLTFDKSRLAPNGNSHFVRLQNVASYSVPSNANVQEDAILLTIPIRTSVKWSAEVTILTLHSRGGCCLNLGAYTKNAQSPSVNVVWGQSDDIVDSVVFCYDSLDVKVIIRLHPDLNKSWMKVNISDFYHLGYENVNLSDKSLYKVELVNESDLTELIVRSTINNTEFRSSDTLYSKDGRIFYNKRFDADIVPEDARSNLFVGLDAGIDSGFGTDNIAIGTRALNGNGDFSIYNCIAIGHETLREYQLQDSLAIGYRALNKTTTGNRNVAIGNSALLVNETGGFNTALGFHALWSNLIGNNNVAVGYNALAGVKDNNNTALGFRAGDGINNGSDNIAIGATCLIGTTSQNISSVIAIGNKIKPQSGTDINEIIIGHSLTGKGSNTVLIGNTSIEKTYLNGTVDAPKFKVSSLNTPPLTSTDLGEVGEIRITHDYIYVCIAINTWVRANLNSW